MKLPNVIRDGLPGTSGFDTLCVLHAKGSEISSGKNNSARDGIDEF